MGRVALGASCTQIRNQTSVSLNEYRWYAVHTLPYREFGAVRQLEFQDFKPFLPVHLKTVRHARSFRTIRAPFFPRYLFVRLNLSRDRWRAVNGTFGVSSLIMEGELPKPVPMGVVEQLTAISDELGLLSFGPRIQPGQNVRILTGPFADRVGRLLSADANSRVRILLEVMGTPVVVRSTGDRLAPVA